jgi:hypothetical protein
MAGIANPRFSVNFLLNNSPKDIAITDITDWTGSGVVSSDIEILLWVVAGNGVTIHKNTGYDTDDYSSPDISAGGGSKTGIALPVDDQGDVIEGTYYFYYKAKDSVLSTEYTTNKSYLYTYTKPTVVINLEYSCRESTLTSVDATDYDVNGVSPTMTRDHTITKPFGSGANTPGTTADATRVIGGGSTSATRLWTRIWVTAISTDVSYEMQTWGGSTWITITDTITGSDSIDVSCSDCIGNMQTCLSALYDRWVTAKGNNKMEAQRLGNVILEIMTLWQEYESAQRNGEDYSIKAGEIAVLLSKEGFSCTYENDGESVVVVPWGQALGGGGVGAAIYLITTLPTAGNSGDWAIGKPNVPLIEYGLWYNNGGTWEYQGSIKGGDGAAGDSYEPVLNQGISISGALAQTGWQVLKSYALAVGEVDDDDDIEIEAAFLYNSNQKIPSEIGLRIGTINIITRAFGESPTIGSTYTFYARLVKTNDASAYVTAYIIAQDGDPAQIWDVMMGALGVDFTKIQTISASCTKPVDVGTLNDIQCHYLRIKKNVKRT